MIELRAFGSPALDRITGERRRPIHLGPRRLALLVYLAIEGQERPIRRDALLALFWPEKDAQHARGALRQALYALRSSLGESVVEAGGDDDLRAAGELRCDVTAFRAALRAGAWKEAADAYVGHFLEGFFAPEAPGFERWVEETRAELRREASGAAWKAAGALPPEVSPEEIGRLAQRAVAWAPHDEALVRRAVELLASIGDRAGAVALYERFAERLRSDYDLEPTGETVSAVAAIREGQAQPSPGGGDGSGVRPRAMHGGAAVVPPAADAPAAVPPGFHAGDGRLEATSPRGPARRLPLWAGATLVVLGIAGWFVPWPPEAPPARRPALAVLPLRDVGPSRHPGFAEGLADELRSRLAQNPGLKVVAGGSSVALAGAPPAEIGVALGIDFLLSGSVRWAGDSTGEARIRVTPVLVRTTDGAEVWSDRYDARIEDAFEVQARIAAAVAARLGAAVGGSSRPAPEEPPTADPLAYTYYLRGSHFLTREWVGPNLRLASRMLRQAVDLDPSFALAWARLSMARSELYQGFWDRSDSVRLSARRAADRALELDPELTEGLFARGLYHYRVELDYERSLGDLERVARRRPDDPRLLTVLAYLERRRGNWQRAVEHHERALALDPLVPAGRAGATWTYIRMRRYADAERHIREALELFPEQRGFHGTMAMLQVLLGDVEAARAVLERAATDLGFPRRGTTWLTVELLGRRYDEALGLLHQDADPAADHMWRGRLHRLAGRQGRARAHFDSASLEYRRRVRESPDDPWHRSLLGLALAGAGRGGPATAEGRRAIELLPVSRDAMDGPLFLERLARILVFTGEHDEAVAVLDRLLAIPSEMSVPLLLIHPEYDPLRGHPGFQALVGGGGRLSALRDPDAHVRRER